MKLQDHVTNYTKNFVVFIIVLKQSDISCHILSYEETVTGKLSS